MSKPKSETIERRKGINLLKEIFIEEQKVKEKHYQKIQMGRDEYYWYNYLKAQAFDRILGLAKAKKKLDEEKL